MMVTVLDAMQTQYTERILARRTCFYSGQKEKSIHIDLSHRLYYVYQKKKPKNKKDTFSVSVVYGVYPCPNYISDFLPNLS